MVALIGGQALRQVGRERVAEAALAQSYARRTELKTVFSLLQDAETGQRGYLLTGHPVFLEPYEAAHEKLGVALDRAERAYAGRRPGALAEVRRLTAEHQAGLQQGLAAHEAGLPASTSQALAAKRTMDELRQVLSSLLEQEAAELDRLQGRARVQDAQTRASVIGLGALATLLLLASALILLRFLRQQQRLLEAVAASARRQDALFQGSRTPLLILTPDARIEDMNPATERLFGWSPEDLTDKDISILIDETGPGDAHILQRLANRQGYLEEEIEGAICGRRRDGSRFSAEISVSPVSVGDESHIIAAVRDVSERRRVEEMKNQFVSTVSHELRTPLTSIAGSLGLLAGGAAGPLPEKAARLIGIAQSNSQRLVRLINDILDIEKIESGQMTLQVEQVQVRDVVSRSIDSVRGMADEAGVRLILKDGDDAVVAGDPDRLIQIVVNLLSNAVKFSPRDGVVEVSTVPAGRSVRISVTDRGPGIPVAFRARIFQKFAQADSSDTRQRGGTGLGLVISREIAERHGGRLWFESRPGEGATFHLDLPLSTASAGEADRNAIGPRLLIVEDDADAAEVMRSILAEDGFKADVAATAREALAAVGSRAYSAALIDLQLPDGDGLALIRALRGRPDTHDLPVMVVSADVSRGQARACSLEVLDWLEKPLDADRLRTALEAALARCASRRPLVLQVDDEADIRRLTASALSGTAEFLSAGSLAEARARLSARRPAVVLLDLGLPDGSGLELLSELQAADGVSIPVIIYSAREPELLNAPGVEAVLLKSRTSLATLARTVRRVAGREAR